MDDGLPHSLQACIRAYNLRHFKVKVSGSLENDLERLEDIARVILNARTGSIVMNKEVKLDTVAVAHGNLSVIISSEPLVSQPAAFSQGQTVTSESAEIEIKEKKGELVMVKAGASLGEVVKALNAVGATPQDLLAILQAMKAAGALKADLEVI